MSKKKKSKQDLEALKDMAAREALIVDSNDKSQETNVGAGGRARDPQTRPIFPQV